MNSTLVIEEGAKVQTVYGNVIEVLEVNDNVVRGYTGGSSEDYHISKPVKVVSEDTALSSYATTMHAIKTAAIREGRKTRRAVRAAQSIVR